MPCYGDARISSRASKKPWRYPGVPIPERLRGKYQDYSLRRQ